MQEEIRIQNAKLAKLRLEQALAIRESSLAIQAREREVERAEKFPGKEKSEVMHGSHMVYYG